ncbi:hypothetical protein C8R45DRAFT_1046423, partial [Mycena sanguinolenta]
MRAASREWRHHVRVDVGGVVVSGQTRSAYCCCWCPRLRNNSRERACSPSPTPECKGRVDNSKFASDQNACLDIPRTRSQDRLVCTRGCTSRDSGCAVPMATLGNKFRGGIESLRRCRLAGLAQGGTTRVARRAVGATAVFVHVVRTARTAVVLS